MAVVAAALVATAWVWNLSLRADDFFLIPSAGAALGLDDWPPIEEPRYSVVPGVLGGRMFNESFFRPVHWFLLWVLHLPQRTVVHAWTFHGAMAISHALCAFLLRRILRERLGPWPATIGALAFAIAPAGMDAVAWVAAGGDQLSVLVALGAARAVQRAARGSGRALLWAATCSGLSVLAKDTAIVLWPAVVAAALLVPAALRTRSIARLAITTAAGLGLALVARGLYLHDFGPRYFRDLTDEAHPTVSFLRAAANLLIPWERSPSATSLAPAVARIAASLFGAGAQVALATAVGLALIAAGFRRDGARRRMLASGLAFALMLVALTPAAIVADEAYSPIGTSRALYLATPLFAVLFAISAEGVRLRRAFATAILALTACFAIEVDLLVHVARCEIAAADANTRMIEEVDQITAARPPDTLFFVLDEELVQNGMPLIGTDIEAAMKPPFHRPGRKAYWWPDYRMMLASPDLASEPRPMQLIAHQGGHDVAVGPLIPARPDPWPELRTTAANSRDATLTTPIPARFLGAIEWPVGEPPEARTARCAWLAGDQTQVVEVPLRVITGSRLLIPPPTNPAWRLTALVTGVRLDGPIPTGRPTHLDRLPVLAAHAGAPGSPDVSTARPITFHPITGASRYRLQVVYRFVRNYLLPLAYEFNAGDLPASPDGDRTFDPTSRAPDEAPICSPRRSGSETLAAALRWGFGPYGPGRVRVSWQLEALDELRNVIARSEWAEFTLAQRPALDTR